MSMACNERVLEILKGDPPRPERLQECDRVIIRDGTALQLGGWVMALAQSQAAPILEIRTFLGKENLALIKASNIVTIVYETLSLDGRVDMGWLMPLMQTARDITLEVAFFKDSALAYLLDNLGTVRCDLALILDADKRPATLQEFVMSRLRCAVGQDLSEGNLKANLDAIRTGGQAPEGARWTMGLGDHRQDVETIIRYYMNHSE